MAAAFDIGFYAGTGLMSRPLIIPIQQVGWSTRGYSGRSLYCAGPSLGQKSSKIARDN